MSILVTGGAGYIGSHTVAELLERGKDVIVVDNLSNSKPESLKRVQKLTGRTLKFVEADVCDAAKFAKVFAGGGIDSVIHFAGLKAVGESVSVPLKYYENNIMSTLSLLKVMAEFKVRNIVFSSSATVYGLPKSVPINEDFPLSATNPYGRTKLFIEEILRDAAAADKKLNIAILRYFNPVGAHASHTIGEDPNGIPNNLVPYITQVLVGRLPKLKVYGGDYPTRDGTGVRDYIHVVDLAKGHLAALNALEKNCGVLTVNLGTGVGYSVLDMVKAFEKVSGKKVPYEIVARRAGDIAECYADPSKAKKELGWSAEYGLERMCNDSYQWQIKNPNGF